MECRKCGEVFELDMDGYCDNCYPIDGFDDEFGGYEHLSPPTHQRKGK